MVRIIEFQTEAAGRRLLELNVLYRDDADVMATVDLIDRGHSYRRIGPAEVPDALPVAEAFLTAIALAEREGIPFLWIRDPKNLFPPEKRPVREIGGK